MGFFLVFSFYSPKIVFIMLKAKPKVLPVNNGIELQKVTFYPVLQPITDKESGQTFDYLPSEKDPQRARICIALIDKTGQFVTDWEGKIKLIYRSFKRSELKPELEVNKSPFKDNTTCLKIAKFSTPQFTGQKAGRDGKYINYLTDTDEYWANFQPKM